MICGNCQREIADYSRYCYFCGKHQATGFAGSPTQRLHRSVTDSKIAGVCGGIAEYFQVDSTIVRLVWAFVTFFTAIVPGIAVYILAWILMPEMPVVMPTAAPVQSTPEAPRA
jgi:phage shock protein C